MSNVPAPLENWISSIPQQNVGKLFVTIKIPLLPIWKEYKLQAWGQLCDGRDHRDFVHNMLYNQFPRHGKGYTYVSWRAVPDNPEVNKYPRSGKVENPKPYDGIAYH